MRPVLKLWSNTIGLWFQACKTSNYIEESLKMPQLTFRRCELSDLQLWRWWNQSVELRNVESPRVTRTMPQKVLKRTGLLKNIFQLQQASSWKTNGEEFTAPNATLYHIDQRYKLTIRENRYWCSSNGPCNRTMWIQVPRKHIATSDICMCQFYPFNSCVRIYRL